MTEENETKLGTKTASLNVKLSIAPPEVIDVKIQDTSTCEDGSTVSSHEKGKAGVNSMSWCIDDKPPVALSLVLGFQV